MKLTKKIVSLLLTVCLLLGLAACGTQESETKDTTNENPTTGDTTTEMKPIILAVSFGSSYNETREATIDATEAALQTAYPEYEVRRAFTSQIVIDILVNGGICVGALEEHLIKGDIVYGRVD